MKMNQLAAFLLIPVLLLAPACALMSPQQQSAARQTIEEEYRAGRITRTQADAAIEAVEANGPTNWDALLMSGANILMAVLLGTPIAVGVVQRKRGPVATLEERVARSKSARK